VAKDLVAKNFGGKIFRGRSRLACVVDKNIKTNAVPHGLALVRKIEKRFL